MATSTEVVTFSNISATTAAFALRGGKYVFTVNATFGAGSVALQTPGGDGSTWIPISTADRRGQRLSRPLSRSVPHRRRGRFDNGLRHCRAGTDLTMPGCSDVSFRGEAEILCSL